MNEDLAATAIWGSQQTELRNEGKYDGVFGLWYGKGPGVDRCGDVFRHSNLAGTSKYGGVLVAMGDDHSAESSTELHQSEYALVDAMMPILYLQAFKIYWILVLKDGRLVGTLVFGSA